MKRVPLLLLVAAATAGCYPKIQLRVYTEVMEDGGASRTLTYMGDDLSWIKLPLGSPWKIEQKPNFYKASAFFPDGRALKTDFFFPRHYPSEDSYSEEDRALLARLRIDKLSPETFYSRNNVSISRRNWFFFTVYRYDETIDNRKVIELLRRVEGIDSIKFKITGKDDKLESILSNMQFVYEVKMPGSLIKTSSKNVRGGYCSWSFSMGDFYWGYRKYAIKATSIKVDYLALTLFGLTIVLLVFGLFWVRTRRSARE
ncbi:MAG: hypothetical protein AB1714_07470 [Acidobacteriota bacterium]